MVANLFCLGFCTVYTLDFEGFMWLKSDNDLWILRGHRHHAIEHSTRKKKEACKHTGFYGVLEFFNTITSYNMVVHFKIIWLYLSNTYII